jgi:hypothetical protein
VLGSGSNVYKGPVGQRKRSTVSEAERRVAGITECKGAWCDISSRERLKAL